MKILCMIGEILCFIVAAFFFLLFLLTNSYISFAIFFVVAGIVLKVVKKRVA